MDWHPTQGGGAGVDILLVASRISSCLSSWLVCRPLSLNANDLKESSAIFWMQDATTATNCIESLLSSIESRVRDIKKLNHEKSKRWNLFSTLLAQVTQWANIQRQSQREKEESYHLYPKLLTSRMSNTKLCAVMFLAARKVPGERWNSSRFWVQWFTTELIFIRVVSVLFSPCCFECFVAIYDL